MASPQFEATVRHHNRLAVIDLSGEVNREAETGLMAAWERASTGADRPVLLNFANVDYINSTGIALIVGLLARGRASGRQLVVCGLSDHYRQIFEITRLIDFMRIYPDESSALAEVTPIPA